ncbi:4-trimethylaminobutyraldehyde dehydrogenase-like isoform X1 [Schistocerca gregaria]|uniref:4-trimethylaminobutyraldehyde dehydrogenase-like isoform X1 n=2 Tax=Schistocerca gregaria TaxID=7010 RepID=UPI00211E7D46|nr:4-trimethylaminobutyraldehyde dehydrogenase-like isoform X1 [Schistocerca gregaria]
MLLKQVFIGRKHPLSTYNCGLVKFPIRRLTSATGPFNFVDGKRVEPVDRLCDTTVINPAKGEELCHVPSSGKLEVARAVSAAKEAFKTWSQFSNTERGKLLTAVGSKIRSNLEDIAHLEVLNNGKPIWEARVDIASCADAFEYFGGTIASLTGQHVPLQGDNFAMVCREPLGVVVGIGAWNFPLQTCSWKVAPALACGNTMVYKPSQLTPLTAILLAEILTDVGVPKGVLNIVQGAGETGSHMCHHPDVAKISFTGSVATGVNIMTAAAAGMKKVTLELGGKSPLIIFNDADVDNAVKAALVANFLSQGQVCSNGTRVFVQNAIAEEVLERLVNATNNLKIGDPFEEDTTVGATISEEQAEKVLSYIKEAEKKGAIVLCGGRRISLPAPLENGIFVSPCILSNCHDDMRVVKEEVFGAVMTFLTFSTEEEVVQRANKTPYGLAGGVFTRDLSRAFRVIRQLEAGTVWINNYNLYPPELPFGGYKWSGIGRENGTAVFEHYTQTKTVFVETGDVDAGPLYPQ